MTKFKLYQSIRPQYASDLIVTVNFLTENKIFFADRKGRCEIWEFTETKFIQSDRLSIFNSETCLHQSVLVNLYDRNIVVACNDTGDSIFVWSSNSSSYNGWDYSKTKFPYDAEFKQNRLFVSNNRVILEKSNQDHAEMYSILIDLSEENDILITKGPKIIESELKLPKKSFYSISDLVWRNNFSIDTILFDATSVRSCSRMDVSDTTIISKCFVRKGSELSDGTILHNYDDQYDYYESLSKIYSICSNDKFIIVGHDGYITIWM